MPLKVGHVLTSVAASLAAAAFFSWQTWHDSQALTSDQIATAPVGCVQTEVKRQIGLRSSPVTNSHLKHITTACEEQRARDKQLEAVTTNTTVRE